MKRFLTIITLFLIFTHYSYNQNLGMPNPAAKYCNIMGYEYKIIDGKTGEKGICILPDETNVSAWDFYKGKVGKDYSYCAQKGYSMETRVINHGSYIEECPICVQKDKGIEIPMLELMEQNGESLIDYELNRNISLVNDDEKTDDNILTFKSLPTAFDWRNRDGHAYIGDIRDQGNCGSCYAFAAVASAECTYNWKNHFRDDCRFEFSKSFIIWCLGSLPQWYDNF